jgi:hypothetical protein
MMFAACLGLLAAIPLAAQTNPASAKEIRGEPIRTLPVVPSAPANTSTSSEARLTVLDRADEKDGEFIRLGFDKLSAFDYDVFEVYSETNAGRPLLKSTNSIPLQIKAYDGRRVSVSGFVLPLRTRNRLVSEFLLLRDQGTCCFGARAQVNHFVRVRLKGGGFSPGAIVPYKASGVFHAGETYVGDYLTGIYSLDAEKVVPEDEPPAGL